MSKATNQINFEGSFLADIAEILNDIHQDGDKISLDALFLMEIISLKQANSSFPGGLFSKCHVVGSTGECVSCLDVFSNESDMDVMCVMKSMTAFERHPGRGSSEHEQCYQFDDTDTLPGYVKLKLIILEDHTDSNEEAATFLPSCEIRQNAMNFYDDTSSVLFSQMFQLLGNNMSVNWFNNGPSFSTSIKSDDQNVLTRKLAHINSVDSVVAIQCREWPKIADEWIERRREYEWPAGALIEEVVETGCCLVPIGGHMSCHKDLEWRISFVLAERLLIRRMSFVQRFVYSLSKTIKKEVFGVFSDVISSYIIKTAILWVSEESDVSKWRPKMVLLYVRLRFLKILNFLQADFCPNYFMRACNLFHAKYSEHDRLTLIDIVTNFLNPSHFLKTLNNIKSIQNVKKNMYNYLRILSSHTSTLKDLRNGILYRYVSEETMNQFMKGLFSKTEEADPVVAIKYLSRLLRQVKENNDQLSARFRETLVENLSALQIRAVTANAYRNMTSSTEPLSTQQRFEFLQNLIEESRLKATELSIGGLTQIAHSFFSLGCVENCLHLLNPIVDMTRSKPQIRMNNYMSMFNLLAVNLFSDPSCLGISSPVRPVVDIQFYSFELPMLTRDINIECLLLELQHAHYSNLCFGTEGFTFKVSLDPVIYACYMKFKCLRRMEDNIGSCVALREFEEMTNKGICHRYTALNLLGCCLWENGYKEKAILVLGRSVRENRGRLATYYHIAMMLNGEMRQRFEVCTV